MSTGFDPLTADMADADYSSVDSGGGGVSVDMLLLALLHRAGQEGPFIKAAMRRLITQTVEALATEMQKGK